MGPGEIDAGGRIINYRKAMIATGSSPIVPGIPGLREAQPLTSDSVWDLTELPNRLVVVGGGAIGCELGQAFSRLGSAVTIVEAEPRILGNLGQNVSELIAARFQAEGITVLQNSKVTGVEGSVANSDLVVVVDDDTQIPTDHILVAVGRRPNTARLNLRVVDVELTEGGYVDVDDKLETTNDHIYAGGDVTGKLPFTHTAGYHAGLVVSNALFGLRRKADHTNIPFAIFCDPEVASVGRTSADDEVSIAHFDYGQLDRQVTTGDPVGFVDLFTDDKGRLVGATIVGEAAGETINEMTARIHAGDKLRAIGQMVRPYPTFAEGPAKAANEVLREQFFTPRTAKFTKPVLSLLRKFDRP